MIDSARFSAITSAMFPTIDPSPLMDDPGGVRESIAETLEVTFNYMFGDIEREIRLAERGGDGCCEAGGGNYLAALGLLCYTEYMGSWITGEYGDKRSTANFNAFFRLMGDDYAALLRRDVKVYDVFRNGMAHRYAPKEFCAIHMLETELDPRPTIGIVETGEEWPKYRFIVRNYFAEFKRLSLDISELLSSFPRVPKEIPRDRGKRPRNRSRRRAR